MSSSTTIDLADHDLAALQEARGLLPRAEFYAEWAVRESRIGKVADKIAKNQIACTLRP